MSGKLLLTLVSFIGRHCVTLYYDDIFDIVMLKLASYNNLLCAVCDVQGWVVTFCHN